MLLWVTLYNSYPVSLKAESQRYSSKGKPHILELIPKNVEGFRYVDYYEYPEPYGYSLRYLYEKNNMVHSDVYLYPSGIDSKLYSHKEIVLGMTDILMNEFDITVKKGMYSEFRAIKSSSFSVLDKIVTRNDLYLVRDNLETYSLLFLTESNGRMIKIRMSMPNNTHNRKSTNWQKFANQIIRFILENIEKT